jgi:rhodanese-related sulfurtransferase
MNLLFSAIEGDRKARCNAGPHAPAAKRVAALAAILAGMLVLSLAPAAQAIDVAQVPQHKQTKPGLYVDAREAYALKQQLGDKAMLIDIRTRGEVSYTGVASAMDAHVPLLEHPVNAAWDEKAGRFRLEFNNDFDAEIARRMAAKGLGKSDTVILICRSGDRSSKAVNLLAELGYTQVYSVVDGFEGDVAKDGPLAGQRVVNGWKNAGLPWTYKLDKDKLYLPQK